MPYNLNSEMGPRKVIDFSDCLAYFWLKGWELLSEVKLEVKHLLCKLLLCLVLPKISSAVCCYSYCLRYEPCPVTAQFWDHATVEWQIKALREVVTFCLPTPPPISLKRTPSSTGGWGEGEGEKFLIPTQWAELVLGTMRLSALHFQCQHPSCLLLSYHSPSPGSHPQSHIYPLQPRTGPLSFLS